MASMAPVFPSEIFQMIVDEVTPPTLLNVACTCKALLALCDKRLAQHRTWEERYRVFRYCEHAPKHGYSYDEAQLFQLACDIGFEARIAWHIQEFTACALGTLGHPVSSWVRLYGFRGGSGLQEFLTCEPFSSNRNAKNLIADWSIGLKTLPVVTTLLFRATRLRSLHIFCDDIESRYFERVMAREWADKSRRGWNLLPFLHVHKLVLEGKSPTSSVPVNVLMCFPSLVALFLQWMQVTTSRTSGETDQLSVPITRTLLSKFSLLSIDRIAFEKKAMSLLLGSASNLDEIDFFGPAHGPRGPEDFDDADICELLSAHETRNSVTSLSLHWDSPIRPLNLRTMNNLKSLSLSYPIDASDNVQPLASMLPASIRDIRLVNANTITPVQPGAIRKLFENFHLEAFPALRGIELELELPETVDGEDLIRTKDTETALYNVLRNSDVFICPIAYSIGVPDEENNRPYNSDVDPHIMYVDIWSPKWTFLRWNQMLFNIVERACTQMHGEVEGPKIVTAQDMEALCHQLQKLEDDFDRNVHTRASWCSF